MYRAGSAGCVFASAAHSYLCAQLDVRKRLEERHPALKRSIHMKNASGRYAVDLEVEGKPPAFKKLPVVSAAQFDDFIRNVVPPDQLVMVACLREDDPACRTACQVGGCRMLCFGFTHLTLCV